MSKDNYPVLPEEDQKSIFSNSIPKSSCSFWFKAPDKVFCLGGNHDHIDNLKMDLSAFGLTEAEVSVSSNNSNGVEWLPIINKVECSGWLRGRVWSGISVLVEGVHVSSDSILNLGIQLNKDGSCKVFV